MSFHDSMLKGLGVGKHSNTNELMKKPPKERTVPKILDFKPKFSVSDGIHELLNALDNHVFDNVDQNCRIYGNYKIESFEK